MSKVHTRPRTNQVPVTIKPSTPGKSEIPVAKAHSLEDLGKLPGLRTAEQDTILDLPTGDASAPDGPSAEESTDGADFGNDLSLDDFSDSTEGQKESADPITREQQDEVDLSLLQGAMSPSEESNVPGSPELRESGFLQIYRPNCLICKALVPFKKKTFWECHYKKGNTACPAASTKVVVRIPLEQIVPKFLQAEREGDFLRLAKLSATLGKKPDWYRQAVVTAIDEGRKGIRTW